MSRDIPDGRTQGVGSAVCCLAGPVRQELLAEVLHGTVGLAWTLPWAARIRKLCQQVVTSVDDDPNIPTPNGRIFGALIPRAELPGYAGGHIDLVASPGVLLPHIERFLATAVLPLDRTADPA